MGDSHNDFETSMPRMDAAVRSSANSAPPDGPPAMQQQEPFEDRNLHSSPVDLGDLPLEGSLEQPTSGHTVAIWSGHKPHDGLPAPVLKRGQIVRGCERARTPPRMHGTCNPGFRNGRIVGYAGASTSITSTASASRNASCPAFPIGQIEEGKKGREENIIEKLFNLHIAPMLSSRQWMIRQGNDGKEKAYVPPKSIICKGATRTRKECDYTSYRDVVEHFRTDPVFFEDSLARYVVGFMDTLANVLSSESFHGRIGKAMNGRKNWRDVAEDVKRERAYFRMILETVEDQMLIPCLVGGLHCPSAVEQLHAPMALEDKKVNGSAVAVEEAKAKICEVATHAPSDYVVAKKRLPRYIGSTGVMMFSRSSTGGSSEAETVAQAIQRETISAYCRSLKGKAAVERVKCDNKRLLQVNIAADPDSRHSVVMHAKGQYQLVDCARRNVQDYINWSVARYNLNEILQNGESLELDVYLTTGTNTLGLRLTDKMWEGSFFSNPNGQPRDTSVSSSQCGVWIHSVVRDSIVDTTIGRRALARGAFILRLNGAPVRTIADVSQAWEAAVRTPGVEKAQITVCVPRNADLGSIDASKVAGGPRRRDGAAYRGKFKFQDNKGTRKLKKQSSKPLPFKAATGSSRVERIDSNTNNNKTSKASAALASYSHFVEKYRHLKTIEFRGVNPQTLNKSLWDRHKKMYGDSCDASCPCALFLPSLCENVLADAKAKQLKKKGISPAQSSVVEVGFVKYFFPKFIDKVKAEFPNDHPGQLLQKIFSMWSKHKEERRFGNTCTALCPCIEGWEAVFVAKCLHPSKLTKKKRLAPASSVRSFPNPTRQKTSEEVHKAKAASSLSIPRSVAPKSSKSMASISDSSTKVQQEYALVFDASVPLRFYCVTQTKGASSSVCKVTSVDPFNKNKDVRLVSGTIVVATSTLMGPVVVSAKQEVKTHLDLKQRYEAANEKAQKLKIWFINTDVVAQTVQRSRALAQKCHWANSGTWQGHLSDDGWAGGAAEMSKPREATSTTPASQADTRIDGGRDESRLVSSEKPALDMGPLVKWSAASVPFSRSPRATPKSILRSKAVKLKTSSKVKFSAQLVATKHIVAENAFRSAVLNNDYKAVVDLLQSGNDSSTLDNKGRRPLDIVNDKIQALQQELNYANVADDVAMSVDRHEQTNKKLRNLYLKKNILKSYRDGESLVKSSKDFFEWPSAVQFSILRAENLELSSSAKADLSEDYIFCTVMVDGSKKGNTAKIPLDVSPTWTGGNMPPFICRYNVSNDTYKHKTIRIVLFKGSLSSDVDPLPLGFWTHDVKELRRKISRSEASELECNLDTDNDSLLSGKLVLTVKSERCKRSELSKHLSTVIDWLEKFNKEAEGDNIKANVNVGFPQIGDLSLLHAAIYLADKDSAKRLLCLGANPNDKSDVGTAFELARNLSTLSEERKGLYESLIKCTTALGLHSAPKPCIEVKIEGEKPERNEVATYGLASDLPQHDNFSSHQYQIVSRIPQAPFGGVQYDTKNGNAGQLWQLGDLHEEQLPRLSHVDWMLDASCKRCPHFNRVGGCVLGPECRFAHVQAPVGNEIKATDASPTHEEFCRMHSNIFGVTLSSRDFSVRRAANANGTVFKTAAFHCPKENVIYYAEKGPKGRQSNQGLYWYPDQEAALSAARQVAATALRTRGFPRGEKRKRVDAGLAENSRPEKALKLMEGCNHSNIYNKIFPTHQLKKACWNVSTKTVDAQDLVTASFESPAEHNTTYYPSFHGGICHDGRYYYSNERLAKDVTFWMFLQKMKKEGKIGKVEHLLVGNVPKAKKMPPNVPNTSDKRTHSTPDEILEGCNLSNLYIKIFPGLALRKSCWLFDTSLINGRELVTAAMQSPGDSAKYLPSFHGGILSNGIYYYENEKKAKNVTFYCFLQRMKDLGKIRDINDVIGGDTKAPYLERQNQHGTGLLVHGSSDQTSSSAEDTNPMLLAGYNHSNIYMRIFPGYPLKKSCWSIIWQSIGSSGDLVTVSLASPAEQDAMYNPCMNDGILYQGRYYYKTEKEAKDACFVSFLQQMKQSGKISDIKQLLEGCNLAPSSLSGPKRQESDAPFSEEGKTIDEIMELCNHSNAYIKIFPAHILKKACWTLLRQEIDGETLTTASFRGPAEKHKEYYSRGSGGTLHRGRWWYATEKSAKDSAFYYFLKGLVEAGKISDIKHTLDGQRIF